MFLNNRTHQLMDVFIALKCSREHKNAYLFTYLFTYLFWKCYLCNYCILLLFNFIVKFVFISDIIGVFRGSGASSPTTAKLPKSLTLNLSISTPRPPWPPRTGGKKMLKKEKCWFCPWTQGQCSRERHFWCFL